MWPTAEVRWFIRGTIPEDVLAWFVADFPFLEAQPPRVDVYFPFTGDDGVGIKLREGRIEFKQRYRDLGPVVFSAGVIGVPEMWRKWALGLAAIDSGGAGPVEPDGWISVRKTRLVRNYAFEPGSAALHAVPGTLSPARGCSMELTRVAASGLKAAVGQEWWTVGFEATGAESELLFILETAARQTFDGSGTPRLDLEHSYGYPRWLRQPAF